VIVGGRARIGTFLRAILAALVLALIGSPRVDAQVYVVGVVDAGPRLPQFLEESSKVLSGAYYRVVPLNAGETPGGSQDAVDRMFRSRVDGIWFVTVRAFEQYKKPVFMGDEPWWRVSLEGVFYPMPHGGGDLPRAWTRTVSLEGPVATAAELNRSAVVQLVGSLLQHLGYHEKDDQGPRVRIDYPLEAQALRTSTVLVLGEVTDGSEVAAVSVNGQPLTLAPQPSCRIYVPVTFAEGPMRERLPVVVEAADVYGNLTRREVVAYRGKALQAKVVSTWGDSLTLDRGSLAGIRVGMAFMACNVNGIRDPLTRKKRFEIVPVGPAVVTSVRNNGASAKLLFPGTLKRGDLLR